MRRRRIANLLTGSLLANRVGEILAKIPSRMPLNEHSDDELKQKLSSGELGVKKTAVAEAVLRHRRTERMEELVSHRTGGTSAFTQPGTNPKDELR